MELDHEGERPSRRPGRGFSSSSQESRPKPEEPQPQARVATHQSDRGGMVDSCAEGQVITRDQEVDPLHCTRSRASYTALKNACSDVLCTQIQDFAFSYSDSINQRWAKLLQSFRRQGSRTEVAETKTGRGKAGRSMEILERVPEGSYISSKPRPSLGGCSNSHNSLDSKNTCL